MLFNAYMKTSDEIRRNNLLIAIHRVGSATALSERAGVSAAYLSQIKNQQPESKTGKPKTMGDGVARKIEAAINEPAGWMDNDHTAATQIADVPQGAPIESVLGHGLQWINSEEYKLLTLYRGTDDEGRDKIMRTADVVPKILLAGLTYHKA